MGFSQQNKSHELGLRPDHEVSSCPVLLHSQESTRLWLQQGTQRPAQPTRQLQVGAEENGGPYGGKCGRGMIQKGTP